ncbi:MAG TPA: NAD(P)H-hydrate dehydratase [Mizugakiibacter sp.]|nr:NAD(P)H-hydrate dehydratase [Mizugakiibacter sp.]
MDDLQLNTALYCAEDVRAFDQAAIAAGIPGIELMERAARAGFAALRRRWPEARRVLVLAGPGNNGGDGWLLAREAKRFGLEVQVAELGGQTRGDAAQARHLACAAGVTVSTKVDAAGWASAQVIVDALFGTGLRRAPQGQAAAWIASLQGYAGKVLALDIPSGLDADSGAAPGLAVHAAHTVSFVAWKRGLFTGQGPELQGVVELHDLDISVRHYRHAAVSARLLTEQVSLPPRARDAHKGHFGQVLVIGGELGFAGAARLCGEAALRAGAGRVSVATREAHVIALVAARPELMVHAAEDQETLLRLSQRATILAVGPGLGQGHWGTMQWRAALTAGVPMVLDADGLNLLARTPLPLPPDSVLTPHPGEAARLLRTSIAAIQHDRFAAVQVLAERFHAVAVLKGAGTLIAHPDGRMAVCVAGNPGMASGGMGDVLTGLIAALRAQNLTAWDAACLGVNLHARAADAAARQGGERGLLGSDLFRWIRQGLGTGRG